MARKREQIDRSSLLTALVVVMLVLGVGIMLYPTLADLYNRIGASRTISGYDEAVERQSREERRRLWQEAQSYNKDLARQTLARGGTIDFWSHTSEEEARYQEFLSVGDDGTMGYVSIPKIGVRLPVGHGIGEKVLQTGTGHLEGSSLPVGGKSTNCVITGHTGLPSARLFTDLNQLEEGDTFSLTVLGQTLTYEVCQVRVVLPTDVDSLRIEEGEDLCTLLTCTPYGINDHRLLVTGRRVATPEDVGQSEGGANPWLVPLLVVLVAAVAAVVVYLTRRKRGGGGRHARTGRPFVTRRQKEEDRQR